MPLDELALTVAVLGALGLVANRFGLSAIPAYLLAGLLLGPNEPRVLTLVEPNDVMHFLAELGVIFLLFFLGLEFSLGRFSRAGRQFGVGGAVDLLINGAVGLIVGVAAFGLTFAALVLAAAVYVSSSAIAVKGLIDFRRLADEEVTLVLAILLFEDIVIAIALGLAGGAGGELETLELVGKAIAFIAVALAASRWLARPIDRALDRLPREFFLLATFAFVIGAAALGDALGLSAAIGALLAGVVLANTDAREEIEERFFSFRDLFAAFFFFVFGLQIDVLGLDDVGWLLALALVLTVAAKLVTGVVSGVATGYTPRQGLNVGAALVAHGEFTIVIAQLAATNPAIAPDVRADLVAFAGLYVLATATVGVALMKESKRIGRRLFGRPTLRGRGP